MRGDLLRILGRLLKPKDRLDGVLIETTGLADPGPAAQTFFNDPEIRDAYVRDCAGAGPAGREPVALPHADRVCAVAFQHACGLLATAVNDNDIGLWSPTRSEPLVASVKLTAPASKLAWSLDDTKLAIGAQKGGVLVLKVEDGENLIQKP